MKKIVVNRSFGGFGLSDEALVRLGRSDAWNIDRDDPELVKCVEELGAKRASGEFSKLDIVTLSDEVTDWEISEYDGLEEVICVINGMIYHE